ncbi:YbjQ family protein [Roseicyclus marinus]|jgi:uncharacterized protein YbjQ (UPF0145 family)|uniref:YbjQ family protein n=1 Tax=Roseicyclus marinus TaxID=2161673 RepID=UPI002410175C|nr:heavy metal-binding domain-containing protein [Roseicyclus marinus]MDG3039851.1 heavy metal-binding domain-containing protein [Roseicyclus marinus]
MALCKSCGKSLTLLNKATQDLCNTCVSSGHTKANSAAPRKAEVDAIMLTTETQLDGIRVTRRIEIVTAECAFGMNIFKDLFAGVRDIVGGRSEAVQQTLRDARRTALYELKKEAHAVGANAVIGVDLDYVELSAAGSMVLLVASGTAVIVEEKL